MSDDCPPRSDNSNQQPTPTQLDGTHSAMTGNADLTQVTRQAEAGDPSAQFQLGSRYATQNGGQVDDQKAAYWWQKSAEQGHAPAMFALGSRYLRGRGVLKDTNLGLQWQEKAAQRGLVRAQLILGERYITGGDGIAADPQRALYWLEAAARQDNAEAEDKLGSAYLNGTIVQKDVNQAMSWFQRAASHGNRHAQNELDNYAAYLRNAQSPVTTPQIQRAPAAKGPMPLGAAQSAASPVELAASIAQVVSDIRNGRHSNNAGPVPSPSSVPATAANTQGANQNQQPSAFGGLKFAGKWIYNDRPAECSIPTNQGNIEMVLSKTGGSRYDGTFKVTGLQKMEGCKVLKSGMASTGKMYGSLNNGVFNFTLQFPGGGAMGELHGYGMVKNGQFESGFTGNSLENAFGTGSGMVDVSRAL